MEETVSAEAVGTSPKAFLWLSTVVISHINFLKWFG